MKFVKIFLIPFITGFIITLAIGYAVTYYNSDQVGYNNSTSGLAANNTKAALNLLYNRAYNISLANATNVDVVKGKKFIGANHQLITGALNTYTVYNYTSTTNNYLKVNAYISNSINATNRYLKGLEDNKVCQCVSTYLNNKTNGSTYSSDVCTLTKGGYAYVVFSKYGSNSRSWSVKINGSTTISNSTSDMADLFSIWEYKVGANGTIQITSWEKKSGDFSMSILKPCPL